MMSSLGYSFFLIHFHFVFVGLAIFGFFAALIWLNKHASKGTAMKVMWWTIAIGIIGMLLTAPFSMRGWYAMMPHQGMFWNQMDEGTRTQMFDSMQKEMEEHMGLEDSSESSNGS